MSNDPFGFRKKSGDAVQNGELEYTLPDGRVAVVWGDLYLHIFDSMEDYANPEIEPIAVIAPTNGKTLG